MAEKIVSPGVFTNEIDASFLPEAIGDIGAAIVGPTVKGPALVPTVVSSYSEYQARFGDVFKSGSSYYQYFTSIAAKNYLDHAGQLTIVRVMGADYEVASATISSSIDTAIVGHANSAPHSASVTLASNFSSSLTGTGMSEYITLTPYGGTEVKLQFTSSLAYGITDNTSTLLHIPSCSTVAITAASASDIFNTSSSLHGLTDISASAGAAVINFVYGSGDGINSSNGAFGVRGEHAGTTETVTPTYVYGGSSIDRYINITASAGVTSSAGEQVQGAANIAIVNFGGGIDFNDGVHKTPFKLHTLSHGAILNNQGTIGTNSVLADGTKDNIRWEITNVNKKKGTFGLAIRSGDDSVKRKNTLENYTGLTLDPKSNDYIGKRIGDSVITIAGTADDPYLTYTGEYPNKSKYVRVEVLEQTEDYLDENGNVRVAAASASLPTFYSGSNSGSEAGAFSGGADGTTTHPINFNENISDGNSQGFNLGTTAVKEQYTKALNLLSNADEYDFNLLLLPGIVRSFSNHTSIVTKAIDVCEDRGDAFVVVDSVGHGTTSLTDVTDQAKAMDSNYAATYWPWVQVPDLQTGQNNWVPPSVSVAGVYSFNDKVAQPWFAPAGLNRGTITTAIQAERKLTNDNRDDLYEKNVNPLATFPGQGVCVWGQKTLQKKSSALDRVNVRRLLIKVKKFIASSSRFLLFEQNNAATRQRFLNIANPFLETVQSQSGLSAFRVVMDETNNTPDVIDRNQLYGQIFLQPTRTAEFIVLDFVVQPTGASFPE